MAKENSWTNPPIPNLIGRKQIDWSMFQWGSTIPIEFHDAFKDLGMPDPDKKLSRQKVTLLYQGRSYRAHIQKALIKTRSNDTYQLRYDSNNNFIDVLKKTFSSSFNYIVAERNRQYRLGKEKPFVVVPIDRAEYIDFLRTDSPYEIEVVFRSLGDIEEDDGNYQHQIELVNVPDDLVIVDAPKQKPNKSGNRHTAVYPRNSSIGKNAIVLSDYSCEFNSDHKDFTSSRTKRNYVEAHHLIPIGFQELFPVSLDVEANIISLCSTCHKRIHHAIFSEKKPMLDLLFKNRFERLKLCNIELTLDQLYTFYS